MELENLNEAENPALQQGDVSGWRSIIEYGFPPMRQSVLITSGDGTIVDVAQWFKEKDGKIRWQQGGISNEFIPECRNAMYWMPIPKPPLACR